MLEFIKSQKGNNLLVFEGYWELRVLSGAFKMTPTTINYTLRIYVSRLIYIKK
jgi:hypothetical protein